MTSYNIDQFSKITNIPKLNLRTWENRYSYLVPSRTDTNIRVYSDSLLVRGINTKLLLENGHKISKVSKMSDDDVQQAVERIGLSDKKDVKVGYYLNNFIISAIKQNLELDGPIITRLMLQKETIGSLLPKKQV